MNGKITKKPAGKQRVPRPARVAEDEILPEYDFGKARRNPYAARLASGGVTVTLDPDVARVFPDSAAVNDALRSLAGAASRRGRKSSPTKRR